MIIALDAMLSLLLGVAVMLLIAGMLVYSKLVDIERKMPVVHPTAKHVYPGLSGRSATVGLPEPDGTGSGVSEGAARTHLGWTWNGQEWFHPDLRIVGEGPDALSIGRFGCVYPVIPFSLDTDWAVAGTIIGGCPEWTNDPAEWAL